MTYTPRELTVRRGDRVIWVNRDLLAHTATSAERRFDSKEIRPQEAWTWVPDAAGEFPYVCSFHPTMGGKVVVR